MIRLPKKSRAQERIGMESEGSIRRIKLEKERLGGSKVAILIYLSHSKP